MPTQTFEEAPMIGSFTFQCRFGLAEQSIADLVALQKQTIGS